MRILLFFLFSFCFCFEIDDINFKTEQISGDFNQSKILVDFGEIKSSGIFQISKDEIFWTTKKPILAEIKINKEGIFEKQNGIWIKNSYDFDKKLFLNILNLNYDELKKDFDINLQKNGKKWKIKLNPKGKILQKIFENIEICGENFIENFNLTEKDGDKTLINFYNVKNEKF